MRVLLVLFHSLSTRLVLHSPVLGELAARESMEITILSPSPEDAETVVATGADHVHWVHLAGLTASGSEQRLGPLALLRHWLWRLAKVLLVVNSNFENLVYRFNEIHGFVGPRQKKAMPLERRRAEAEAGNFVEPELGHPFPHSRLLLRILYSLYYSVWQRGHPAVEDLFDRVRPDRVVLVHLQNKHLLPYYLAARRRGIPFAGIVASWDQPSSKGPLCPGLERIAVHNRLMRQHLSHYHGVAGDRVDVMGWALMDVHKEPNVVCPRDEFVAEIGLAPGKRYILHGANEIRLGSREPELASHMADRITDGAYPGPVVLVIRPHPRDTQWRERFAKAAQSKHVLLLASETGRVDRLSNLLRHADVVVNQGSTIGIDAVALDACTVNVAFEIGKNDTASDNIRRYYESDHLAPAAASGGTRIVTNLDELDDAIRSYLADPSTDAEGRRRLRDEILEPFDGKASKRLCRFIVGAY